MAVPNPTEATRRWFEPASAILMALATLSTVWSSFQSSEWNGQSSSFATKAAGLEQQTAVLHLEDNQIINIQVQLFTDFINARVSGNDKLAQFYSDRFPPELRVAFGRWMAQKPFENLKADPHPFVPALYKTRYAEKVRAGAAEALRDRAEQKRTGDLAAQYLRKTVAFAAVLFFAGTSARFDQRHVRQTSFYFAVALFLFSAVRMLMLPIT